MPHRTIAATFLLLAGLSPLFAAAAQSSTAGDLSPTDSLTRAQLLSRLATARESGDEELASVLGLMLSRRSADPVDALSDSQPDSAKVVVQVNAIAARLYSYARDHEVRGEYRRAIAIYENIRELGGYADSEQRISVLLREAAEAKSRQRLNNVYDRGIMAQRAGRLQEASYWLRQIPAGSPVAGEARKALQDVDDAMQARADEESLRSRYDASILAMNSGDLATAVAMLERIAEEAPGYRSVDSLLDRAQSGFRAIPEAGDSIALTAPVLRRQESGADRNENAEPVPTAVSLRDLDVQHLLRTAQQKMTARTIFLLTAGTIFLVFGLFLRSPARRASLLWQLGMYQPAIREFEQALMQNPTDRSSFAKLSVLYIISGRRDAQAVRVYRRALQLNVRDGDAGHFRQIMQRIVKDADTHELRNGVAIHGVGDVSAGK